MKKRKQTWSKPRHVFWYYWHTAVVGAYCKIKYRFIGERFDNRHRQYLFLFNHQTPFDQELIYWYLPKQPYTVATEDLFTMGAVSRFVSWAQAPIPFKKAASDFSAVKTCMKVAKEGRSIALAPEGNRTFTGETVYIKPSISKLVKLLKLPVAVFSIRGGYNVIPRYADKPRRAGRVTVRVTQVIEPETYKTMSDDELYGLLCKALYVDESDDGTVCGSKRRAEYMERAVYWCPECGAIGTLASKGNRIACSACGTSATVDEHRRFEPPFPVRTVKEWTDRQNEWIRAFDVDSAVKSPIFTETVRLRELVRDRKKVVLKEAEARLYSDRLEIGNLVFPYTEVSGMTVCGRNRMNFYHGSRTYQVTAGNAFCALKYVNFYYHYKNEKEDGDGFLGI